MNDEISVKHFNGLSCCWYCIWQVSEQHMSSNVWTIRNHPYKNINTRSLQCKTQKCLNVEMSKSGSDLELVTMDFEMIWDIDKIYIDYGTTLEYTQNKTGAILAPKGELFNST